MAGLARWWLSDPKWSWKLKGSCFRVNFRLFLPKLVFFYTTPPPSLDILSSFIFTPSPPFYYHIHHLFHQHHGIIFSSVSFILFPAVLDGYAAVFHLVMSRFFSLSLFSSSRMRFRTLLV